jgi:hypothetical protein
VIAAMLVGSGLACSPVLPKRSANWVQICTRRGHTLVDLSRQTARRSPRDSVESKGCAWCVPHAGRRAALADTDADDAYLRLQRFSEAGPVFGWVDGELRTPTPG